MSQASYLCHLELEYSLIHRLGTSALKRFRQIHIPVFRATQDTCRDGNHQHSATPAGCSITIVRFPTKHRSCRAYRGPQSGCQPWEALQLAVRRCHKDAVDLLLKRGSKPDSNGQVLEAEASTGSLTLIGRLFAHGARVDKKQIRTFHEALAEAIHHEHTDMIEYLLSLRTPTVRFHTRLLEKRLKDRDTVPRWGLDSMLEFVRGGFGGAYRSTERRFIRSRATSGSAVNGQRVRYLRSCDHQVEEVCNAIILHSRYVLHLGGQIIHLREAEAQAGHCVLEAVLRCYGNSVQRKGP